MSINWWSASIVVRCGRRVRQTLFHTIGARKRYRAQGSGDKKRGVLRVCIGSCSEKIMSPTPVPEGCSVDAQAFSVFFLRAVVQPSFLLRVVYKAVLVARAADRRRRSRDALPAKRCTCRSGWSQCAFKHCLVTLYRGRGICSSKDACLFLLKRPLVAGVLESNAVSQHSVNVTDDEAFAGQISLMFINPSRKKCFSLH